MSKLVLTSPLPPSVNNYLNYKVATAKTKRKFVQAYSSEETLAYKAYFLPYVQNEIKKQQWTTPEKGKLVFVKMTFFMDRKRKDPNNFLKVPFDVFTEAGVYDDDDIALPIVDRVYIDTANPRIEIEIYESDMIGIFESKDDYEAFFCSNCNGCKRWKNGKCSILASAMQNRIRPEIEDKQCKKRSV